MKNGKLAVTGKTRNVLKLKIKINPVIKLHKNFGKETNE